MAPSPVHPPDRPRAPLRPRRPRRPAAGVRDAAPAVLFAVGGLVELALAPRSGRAVEAHADEQAHAVADERHRIARELHDLVAHSMSVMVVQAGGARRVLELDPGRALEAATTIEALGREALTEMRHLLEVLHPGEPALTPQPALAALDDLIGRARQAGVTVTVAVAGAPRALAPGLGLAAYRIVQEGLTNALKHARGAPTEVVLRWEPETLTLEIRDHGRGPRRDDGQGHGLVGMRERVRIYGGELEAGPVAGGGWRVRAALPLTAVAQELAAA